MYITMLKFLVLKVSILHFVYAVVRPKLTLPDGTITTQKKEVVIQYGESLELFCAGTANEELFMVKDMEMFPTTIVNATTIRFFNEKPAWSVSFIYCSYVKHFDKHHMAAIKAVMGTRPVVKDFHCKSTVEKVNCSWTSVSPNTEHQLYYYTEGDAALVCEVATFGSKYCEINMPSLIFLYKPGEIFFVEKLNLTLTSCNKFGCEDQAFEIDQQSIVKLDPPLLTIKSIETHSVTIEWAIPEYTAIVLEIDYKLTYWYPGIYPRQVTTNDSSISQLTIRLPCADTFYIIRMSIKPKGFQDWSDDATVAFVTKDDNVARHPTCLRVRNTPEEMLYRMHQLLNRIAEEQAAIKNVSAKIP